METKRIISTSTILMIIALVSKCLGFFRDLVLSFFWGASSVSDAFVIAYTIPGTLCDILIQAIIVGFIPLYQKVKNDYNENENLEFVNGFIELLIIIAFPLILISFSFPNIFVRIFANGFDEYSLTLTSNFLRITIFSIVFKIIVSVFSGYLNANNRFFMVGFIGIPYDIIIIIGIVLSFYCNLIFLPVSFVIASLVQTLLLLYCAKKNKYKIKLTKKVFTSNTKEIIKMLLPLLVIVGVNQLNIIVDRTFASYIKIGAISVLDYSNKICLMIENVIANSIALVLYPKLSECFAQNDEISFDKELNLATKKILMYLIPASVFIIINSRNIISFLFGRGSFTQDNIADTSNCMIFYSIGITFAGLRAILLRALYSKKKIGFVSIVSVATLILNIILNFIFIRLLGLEGLALATSISSILATILMMIYLKNIKLKTIINVKSLLINILYCIIIIIIKNLISELPLPVALVDFIQLIIGGILYILVIFLCLRKEEKNEN